MSSSHHVRFLRFLAYGLVVLALGRSAHGEDAPPATPAEAADEVKRAVGDEDALRVLMARRDPDPWLVTDVLCIRGDLDTARAWAAVGTQPGLMTLATYVKTQGPTAANDTSRATLEAVEAAVGREDFDAALAAVGTPPAELNTVPQIRLAHLHANLLRHTGKHDQAVQRFAVAGKAAQSIGWLLRAAQIYEAAGTYAYRGGFLRIAREMLEAGSDVSRLLGDEFGQAAALGNVSNVYMRMGDLDRAEKALKDALVIFEAVGHKRAIATTYGNLGLLNQDRGNHDEARAFQERAIEMNKALGDRGAEARAIGNIGLIERALGDLPAARNAHLHALKIFRSLKHKVGMARQTGNLGIVYRDLGHAAKALSYFKRAIKMKVDVGDPLGISIIENNVGSTYQALGRFPEALATLERVIAETKARGDKRTHARALGNLAALHSTLGDFKRAESTLREALAILRAIGDKPGVAIALGNIGRIQDQFGETEQARNSYAEAISAAKAVGDPGTVALSLSNLAALDEETNPSLARERHDEALRVAEAYGEKELLIGVLTTSGRGRARAGDVEGSLKELDRAVEIARHIRATPRLVQALGARGRVRLNAGDAASALTDAKLALRDLEDLLGGLGEEQGASARARYAGVFALGTEAAAELGLTSDALRFMESGRAGALLEALGGRQALRWTDLPESLAEAQAQARAAEAKARRNYAESFKTDLRKRRREASRVLEAAREQLRVVAERIQREAKREAGLFYPRAAPLDEIQAALHEGQALVVYALPARVALAIVVTPDAHRIVKLGTSTDVIAAASSTQASDLGRDMSTAFKTARERLVAPLGLDASVRQVLISPEGALGYVPFGAIFEQPVALTPSGTTHALLVEEAIEPGRGVLALGDPDYTGAAPGATAVYERGRPLARLPATRVEATAIGDVTLLGQEANETQFQTSLATRERWRAVHLACHGLIDPEHPTLSSLALTSTAEADGFLTALEVLRMQIPADLAVLSACETGTGKIVKGEGIVGLTRAFMYAGAPRVICSLWKVDDVATQALMQKFYELWNPKDASGVSAAIALRQAQQFIRSQKKWAHPYYWAAWSLWGLPD